MTPPAFGPTTGPLRRFVTHGLRATLDAYTAGTLPLHRLTWELHTRLATLAELTSLPHHHTLTTLRDAQQAIATIEPTPRPTGRPPLTDTQHHTLTTALRTLRTGLAHLHPPDPIHPPPPPHTHPHTPPHHRPPPLTTTTHEGGHTAA